MCVADSNMRQPMGRPDRENLLKDQDGKDLNWAKEQKHNC